MNIVRDFIVEFINRLRAQSPKFFKILQYIAVCVILLSYSPWVINRYTDIILPPHFITLCNDIASHGIAFLIALFLPTKPPTVAQTEGGEAVKITNEKKMPFTAKAEAAALKHAEPPPPVVTDVPPEGK